MFKNTVVSKSATAAAAVVIIVAAIAGADVARPAAVVATSPAPVATTTEGN